jgi:hypothetical protein
MTEQKFKSEMRRAKEMERKETDPDRSMYWAGYQRGLQRAFYGEKFKSPEEHTFMMSLIHKPDARSKEFGRGYRDAIEAAEISSKMGRPPVGTEKLAPLPVSKELKDALVEKAKKLDVTLAEVRRLAYEKFCKSK